MSYGPKNSSMPRLTPVQSKLPLGEVIDASLADPTPPSSWTFSRDVRISARYVHKDKVTSTVRTACLVFRRAPVQHDSTTNTAWLRQMICWGMASVINDRSSVVTAVPDHMEQYHPLNAALVGRPYTSSPYPGTHVILLPPPALRPRPLFSNLQTYPGRCVLPILHAIGI